MSNSFCSLGLMSGTSGDGVDASIIQSDGDTKLKVILDRYFEYNKEIYENIHNLRDKINNSSDLNNYSKEVKILEREITLFHANVVDKVIKESKSNINFIGFHGQTIFHNADEKISKQLGDGELLSKNTKKTIIYNFRQNDLINGGQGAPLTPIFHKLIKNKYKIKVPLIFLNIGGIANITSIDKNDQMLSRDIGPGNCLIDKWIRQNSEMKYDLDGKIATSGKINKIILNNLLKNFKVIKEPKSYDIKDFNLSLVSNLSLEDGAATLTEYTSEILYQNLRVFFENSKKNFIISGGGRKNKFLIKKIEKKINCSLSVIDDLGIDGDFTESQAFAYLAIRSYLKLPISFPETTGAKKSCIGGVIVNY